MSAPSPITAAILKLSHLPILVDPSHGTGKRDYVPPMALAALADGADGLLIEVHPEPDKGLSDGAQSRDFAAGPMNQAPLAQPVFTFLRSGALNSGSYKEITLDRDP